MYVKIRNIKTGMEMKFICGNESVGETISNATEELKSLGDMAASQFGKGLQLFTKGEHTLYSQTVDAWTGTEKRTLEIEVKLAAEGPGEPFNKVYKPLKTLCYWATPRAGKIFPGMGDEIAEIADSIGKFDMEGPAALEVIVAAKSEEYPMVHFKRCVIIACTPKYLPPFDITGFPVHGECQLTFKDTGVMDGDDLYPAKQRVPGNSETDYFEEKFQHIGGMVGTNPDFVPGRGFTGEILDLIRRHSGKYGQYAPFLKDIKTYKR